MKKIRFIIIASVSFFVVSCGQITEEKGTLTDELVLKYIKIYKNLREKAPSILENLNENGETAEAGKDGFSDFEDIIKDGGIKDFSEFVKLNAKIGAIFSILQATKGMDKAQDLQNSSSKMMSDGEKFIQEQLNNPDVPEETKAELRKALEELKKGSQQLDNSYNKNRKIAEFVMENVKKITGTIVNKKDIEIVKKHETEIFEAYTGFSQPFENDVKMEFNIND